MTAGLCAVPGCTRIAGNPFDAWWAHRDEHHPTERHARYCTELAEVAPYPITVSCAVPGCRWFAWRLT